MHARHEYAQLAQQCYQAVDNQIQPPTGWRVVYAIRPRADFDNYYVLYENEQKKELVFAIRGTHEVFNWLNNQGLVAGVLMGRSVAPAGQVQLEQLVQSFHQFADDGDRFAELQQAIIEMNREIGNPVNAWFLAILFIGITIYSLILFVTLRNLKH